MATEQIVMRRGDTPEWDIEVFEADGVTPFDLSGCTIWLTVKRLITDADPGVFQLSTTAGTITITDAANGQCTAQPLASQTSGLTADIQGLFDVQVRTAGSPGNTYTVLNGQILIKRDITRA